jgi:hypothetical protein
MVVVAVFFKSKFSALSFFVLLFSYQVVHSNNFAVPVVAISGDNLQFFVLHVQNMVPTVQATSGVLHLHHDAGSIARCVLKLTVYLELVWAFPNFLRPPFISSPRLLVQVQHALVRADAAALLSPDLFKLLDCEPSDHIHVKFLSDCSTTTATENNNPNRFGLWQTQQWRVYCKLACSSVAPSIVMPYGIVALIPPDIPSTNIFSAEEALVFPAVQGFQRGFPSQDGDRFG